MSAAVTVCRAALVGVAVFLWLLSACVEPPATLEDAASALAWLPSPPPDEEYIWGIGCPDGVLLSGKAATYDGTFAYGSGASYGLVRPNNSTSYRLDVYQAFPALPGCSRLVHVAWTLDEDGNPSILGGSLFRVCEDSTLLQGCTATVDFSP